MLVFLLDMVLSEGVEYVFVNGELALEDGEFTGKLSGKALRLN
jgi:hypothetical protein